MWLGNEEYNDMEFMPNMVSSMRKEEMKCGGAGRQEPSGFPGEQGMRLHGGLECTESPWGFPHSRQAT